MLYWWQEITVNIHAILVEETISMLYWLKKQYPCSDHQLVELELSLTHYTKVERGVCYTLIEVTDTPFMTLPHMSLSFILQGQVHVLPNSVNGPLCYRQSCNFTYHNITHVFQELLQR